MRLMCIEVDKDDRQRLFFEFTLYRVYRVWQNAMHQPCITDDDGSGWRLIRHPDGSYRLDTIERVVFIEIPE